MEEDLRLGKTGSLEIAGFEVVEFDLDELMEIGTRISPCGISCTNE